VKQLTEFINEYSFLPWWHAELKSRVDAEAFLANKAIGEFVLRSSTQENAIALSHIDRSGIVGHCLLRMHFATPVDVVSSDNSGIVGRWSIEDQIVRYPSLPHLLKSLDALIGMSNT